MALTRMEGAAERGSDSVVGGMYRHMRALPYLRPGQYRTVLGWCGSAWRSSGRPSLAGSGNGDGGSCTSGPR
ncbi:hypothetical protein [Streptomyces sp. NPDC050560]|uniref:hypothetical protein n=1 Tax=Streptomyces sp. NPDC050560 TaxID=3365630 RepID=UPI003797453F